MTRYGARTLFGLGVVSVVVVFAAVGAAALTPKSAARIEGTVIGLVSLARLREGIPAFVTMHDDVGLDTKARNLRSQGRVHPMAGWAHQEELPIWVVKSGSSVRAFIAIDPRNGCNLNVITGTLFHDVCHGSIYTLAGEHAGGPSPWTLDELVVSIRGGIVYADRHAVLPGNLINR
jgi:Rieske Fe-S protein